MSRLIGRLSENPIRIVVREMERWRVIFFIILGIALCGGNRRRDRMSAKMKSVASLLLALLVVLTLTGCQKICKKGKPCGNTCISRDKTCHRGN
jgi:surface polysaccharide O-acyltransferase-like enzyme